MNPGNLRVKFLLLWAALLVAKLVLAATLPVFVDEAFYAWEGQHLAVAYSDLPALTAWLTRLGTVVGGAHPLALRAPFLLIGAAVPWLVWSISRRWFGAAAGWQAGLLALLMPLSGLLGVLALPDVPLVFASLLCIEAIARLRVRIEPGAVVALAAALALGALSHYRFALVVCAGMVGLACDGPGRRLLRDARVWLAIAVGALAWLPLLLWNLGHANAGLRFQLLERNPWQFHGDGALWLLIQALLVTPLVFALLLATLRMAWRRRRDPGAQPWGLIAGVGGVAVLGYFLLGFFADRHRVSFHWPLAGWLLLICAAPVRLAQWRPALRRAMYALAGVGLLAALVFLGAASQPAWRQALADSPVYPADFAGRQEIAARMRDWHFPADTIVVASDFELGAALAFGLGRNDIRVLDSPLNHKHGRAVQLRDWGLQFDRPSAAVGQAVVLVVDDSATPMKLRLLAYQRLCRVFGALPAAEVFNVDHGRKRYLIYRIDAGARRPGCVAPALAWIDTPLGKGAVPAQFVVDGWAFKDGPGLAAVELTLDGQFVARATYGKPMPDVARYWQVSTDPHQPRVGFHAEVDASRFADGGHWLGLRLLGADGSTEPWPEQRIHIRR